VVVATEIATFTDSIQLILTHNRFLFDKRRAGTALLCWFVCLFNIDFEILYFDLNRMFGAEFDFVLLFEPIFLLIFFILQSAKFAHHRQLLRRFLILLLHLLHFASPLQLNPILLVSGSPTLYDPGLQGSLRLSTILAHGDLSLSNKGEAADDAVATHALHQVVLVLELIVLEAVSTQFGIVTHLYVDRGIVGVPAVNAVVSGE